MYVSDEGSDYFARPLVCDLCERWAEGDAWPTHPAFGFRMCPACKAKGFTVIPRLLTEIELAKWKDSDNTGW